MQSVGSPFHLFHIIILWAWSLYVVSSMILQMFSMGLKSGEVACQPSLAIKFGKFFCNVWAAFAVWAGAPLLHPERLTSLSLSEKTSFLSGKLSPDALMLTVSLLSQGSDCIQKLRFGLWVACVTIRLSTTPSLSHFASFRYLSVCTSLSRLIFEHHWSKQTVIRFLVSIRSILFSTTCSPNIPSCKKISDFFGWMTRWSS